MNGEARPLDTYIGSALVGMLTSAMAGVMVMGVMAAMPGIIDAIGFVALALLGTAANTIGGLITSVLLAFTTFTYANDSIGIGYGERPVDFAGYEDFDMLVNFFDMGYAQAGATISGYLPPESEPSELQNQLNSEGIATETVDLKEGT